MIGTLYERQYLFSYLPSLHNRLRCNWASISEILEPLMHPRILYLNDLQQAYIEGKKILNAVPTVTPFFILNGYTSLINQNNNDALNNLWIVVEQLTEILWKKIYIRHKDNYQRQVKKIHAHYKEKKYLKHIATRHKLLRLSKIITRQHYKKLDCARNARNNLAHRGEQPNRDIVIELWQILAELFEIVTNIQNISLKKLRVVQELNWNSPLNNNFDEWQELVSQIK